MTKMEISWAESRATISRPKKSEFIKLLKEFSASYPSTPEGQKHIAAYSQQRFQGCQNFAEICSAHELGQDITRDVLLKLLPYNDSALSKKNHAWVLYPKYTPTPRMIRFLKAKASDPKWVQPEDWPPLALDIFNFVRRCYENPTDIEAAYQEFIHPPFNKGDFTSNIVTPILNALAPNEFLLINNHSIRVINYFSEMKYSLQLEKYPSLNRREQQLISVLLAPELQKTGVSLRIDDIFDMFSYWLVYVYKYHFRVMKGINESDHPFSEESFKLLAEINKNPRASIYKTKKDEFYQYLIDPFQKLMRQVASKLPESIGDRMETQKYLFSSIKKNDFHHGGAWDFYWGAFYPKGCKRTESAQLFLWINHERIEFGFFVGVYGKEHRDRFQANCQDNPDAISALLNNSLIGTNILFGTRSQHGEGAYRDYQIQSKEDIEIALKSLQDSDLHIAQVLPKDKVFNLSQEQIITLILETYEKVFPFVLLAIEDNPFSKIQDYLSEYNPDLNQQIVELNQTTDIQDQLRSKVNETGFEGYSQPSFIDEFSLTPLGQSASIPAMTRSQQLPPKSNPVYLLSECALELKLDESILREYLLALDRKKQAILYGPPGTGKTFMAHELVKHLLSDGCGFSEVVQFHPAYTYEDFIQGIRPQKDNGILDYPIVPGRFLSFCDRAKELQSDQICVLIIDEINRANLAQVFGELMYLLEYRDKFVSLATGKKFSIPANVRIIGTMNTADRSIALVDHALRRRFAFLHVAPNYELLKQYHHENTQYPVEGLIQQLKILNQNIDDHHYEIGPSYFLREDLAEHIESIWRTEIEPYLEEYFFDQPRKVEQFRWQKVAEKILG
jgi:hypothetical protein